MQEIGNIGAGNAATALSELVHAQLQMSVPRVKILPFAEVSAEVGGGDAILAAVLFQLSGDLDGMMYWILPLSSAQALIAQFFDVQSSEWSEMSLSMLQEVGNIVAGAYLSAVCDFTDLRVYPTPPAMTVDMADAVLADGMIYAADEQDAVVLIETDLQAKQIELSGYFFIMPRAASLFTLLGALGV